MTDDSGPSGKDNPITRRALLAAGTASMMGLAGCSSSGGSGNNSNPTPTPTPVPDPVTGALYSKIAIKQGNLFVQLGGEDGPRRNVKRLSLVGPVVGGGDTAEATIFPGDNPSSTSDNDADDLLGGTQPLQPSEIPRKPVYKSTKIKKGQTEATFSLLQPKYEPRTNNYKSGIYYLLAFGKNGLLAQRRISLVPILTLLDAGISNNGGLTLLLKNTGTGPCYPAYATTIGAMQQSQGGAMLLSGGNGIFSESFILPPSKEQQYLITSEAESAFGAPFSYPRTNSTEGAESSFEAESSAYCTGTGRYSHKLTVVLGLVSGGYVSVQLSVAVGGDPKLIKGEPRDQVVCGSLHVTSPLPEQFTPIQWPSARDNILINTTDEGSQ